MMIHDDFKDDISDFFDCNVIYFLHIKDNIYKYGITEDIANRAYMIRNRIDKNLTIYKLFRVNDIHIAREIENRLAEYAKTNQINCSYKNEEHEFIEVDKSGIVTIIKKLNEWITNFNGDIDELKLETDNVTESMIIEKRKELIEKEKELLEKIDNLMNSCGVKQCVLEQISNIDIDEMRQKLKQTQ